MMSIETKFELNFKVYTYLYFFQLDQKQQKTSRNLEISAMFYKNSNFLQFFPKILKFLHFFEKYDFFFLISVGFSKNSPKLSFV